MRRGRRHILHCTIRNRRIQQDKATGGETSKSGEGTGPSSATGRPVSSSRGASGTCSRGGGRLAATPSSQGASNRNPTRPGAEAMRCRAKSRSNVARSNAPQPMPALAAVTAGARCTPTRGNPRPQLTPVRPPAQAPLAVGHSHVSEGKRSAQQPERATLPHPKKKATGAAAPGTGETP